MWQLGLGYADCCQVAEARGANLHVRTVRFVWFLCEDADVEPWQKLVGDLEMPFVLGWHRSAEDVAVSWKGYGYC